MDKQSTYASRKRYLLLKQNGFSDIQATQLSYDKEYDVTNFRINDQHELVKIKRRSYKLTPSDEKKIRYQLYKDAGYTAKAAAKLKYTDSTDLSGIRVDRKTGKVIKSASYKDVKGIIDVDRSVDVLRNANNTTVFSRHGYLLHDSTYKGRYNKVIGDIKHRDNLSNDQAYYFAYFMLQHKMSYEDTRKELLSRRDFEIYVSKKRHAHKNSIFVNPNKKGNKTQAKKVLATLKRGK